MAQKWFNLCVFALVFFASVSCQLEEGAECVGQEDGTKGICVDIRRCMSVVYDMKLRTHPQLCSFKGRTPIICCTDCELVNDTSNVLVDRWGAHYFKTGRKAEDKCLEYIVDLDYSCTPRDGLKKILDSKRQCYNYETVFVYAAVGGMNANVGEYPHMALLGYGEDLQNAQWLCGGSVISDRFILTAAHCISSHLLGRVKFVALGILKRTDPPEKWQRYNVKTIIPYPDYKAPNKYNDIALLELDKKISFSSLVLPACLNTGGIGEEYAKATGWGALGYRQGLADTLQVVDLQQFAHEECAQAYPPHRNLKNGYDNNTQSCYGDKEAVIDTCEGDSGGPLQVSSVHGSCIYQIIGITSYGRACGFVGNAGMYTRVQYYVPWIESVVWP